MNETPPDDAPPRLALPLVAIAATGGPVVIAAALAASGSAALAAILPLETAFEVSCVLAALVIAVAWPLAALAPGVRAGGLLARLAELVLLAAAGAPSLRLAALLSRAPEDASARALVGLAALAAASALAISGLARTRLRRSTVVVAAAALALGLPLAASFLNDASGSDLGLARVSAPAAVLAQVRAEADPWGLALALALLGIALEALGQVRLRRALRHMVIAGVVLGGAATAAAQEQPPALKIVETRALLGPFVRPGEPAPLRIRLQAGPEGFDGLVGARRGGLLVLVPLTLQPRGTFALAFPSTGAGADTPALEARPTHGAPFVLVSPEGKTEVKPFSTFVGEVEGTPSELSQAGPPADQIFPVVQHTIARRDLDLVGDGGSALSVLMLPATVKPDANLAAFVAEGGTLVLEDATAFDAFVPEGAGPRRESDGLLLRGIGAGTVVARSSGAGSIAALTSYLAVHHARRARTDPSALALAVTESAEPTPSAGKARNLALQAAIVLGALVLSLVAVRRQRRGRQAATFAVASLAVTALVPWLVLRTARAPVILEVSEVLEAPSGGSLASSVELLRFASPRRALADVGLERAPVLAPVFATDAEVSRSRAELELARGDASLAPCAARLRAPVAPGVPALFFRRGTSSLGGAVTIGRHGRSIVVTNGLPGAIEHPILVSNDGVLALDDLPGEASIQRDAGSPFMTVQELFRRMAAAPDAASHARLHLLRTALLTHTTPGTLKLAGFLSRGQRPRTTSGVLDEVEGPVLLIVTDES